ncbi:MAG TPA: segregation/condensation protein A [Bdellovibrionota bacterium]|nr:segregation/condensation protein A [Bdellovibrionota bacterium]
MATRVPITVRLDTFEGPLDLLLYLIQSHELDVSKVSISKITDQYLSYVRLMQELNFDTASEFLVMAATLLHWKSKVLLPQEGKTDANGQPLEDEELSQEDLVRQLIEHQRFLAAGESLAQLPLLGEDVFVRQNRKPPVERVWKEMDVSTLTLTYQDLLVRARKRKQVLKKETVSLTDKIVEFGHRLQIGKLTELRTLLSVAPSRPEIVVTFLASLELARLKKAKLYQEEVYREIYLELLETLANFNVQLASGFEAPKPTDSPMHEEITT